MTAYWEPTLDTTKPVNQYVPNLFGNPPDQRQVPQPPPMAQPRTAARDVPRQSTTWYDPEYEMQLENERLMARYGAAPVDPPTEASQVQVLQPLPTYAQQPASTYGHFAVPQGTDPMSGRASDNMIRALGMKSLFGMKFDTPASINTAMDNADVTSMSYSPEYRQYMDYLAPLVGYDAAAKAATYHTAQQMGAGGSLANSAAWVPVTNALARSTADLNAQVGLTGVDTTSQVAFPYVGAGQVQSVIGDKGEPAFATPSGELVQFDPRLSPAGVAAEVAKLQSLVATPPGALPIAAMGAKGRAGVAVAPGGLAGAVTAANVAKQNSGNKLAELAARAAYDKEKIRLAAALRSAEAAARSARTPAKRSEVDKAQAAYDLFVRKEEYMQANPKPSNKGAPPPAPL